jgi:ABC-type antimicrobial peptide transport system permease subunit
MKKDRNVPPAFAAWVLTKIIRSENRMSILSDFSEIYEELVSEEGSFKARRWYWVQVIRSMPLFIYNKIYWSVVMLTNYIKIAFRIIKRQRIYSFINIIGLAVGITCCLFITMWVRDELSYDKYHEDIENIYQVLIQTDENNITVTPTLLAPLLKEGFPEVVEVTRYHWMFQDAILTHEDKTFYENGLRLAGPSFFTMFNFPFLRGDPETALKDPHSIVITRAIAKKYFSSEDPVGKILTMNHEYELTVTGVMEDLPSNSTLNFDIIIPIQMRIMMEQDWYTAWTNFFVYTFVKLKGNSDPDAFNTKIAAMVKDNGGREDAVLSVMPFVDRHFYLFAEKSSVYVFITIAAFILAIACFNFMNLATARSAKRAKEIGMRKVIGAYRKHIIFQFLGESLLFSITAVIASVLLIALLLPLFNTITGKDIILDQSFIFPVALGLALVTGIAAGSYPAFILSAFQPGKVIKGKLKSGAKNSSLRKVLVVVQFTLSILLIIGMLVIYKQLDYFRNRNMGYDKDHVVSIELGGGNEKSYHTIKNELQREAGLLGVTGTAAPLPYFSWQQSGFHWEGKDPNKIISVSYNAVDHDFVETLKLKIIEGRDFSKDLASDESATYLVNEKMVELMGKESVAGETLFHMENPGTIIGVVEDFHFESFRYQIEPLILQYLPGGIDNLLIRIFSEDVPSSMKIIKQTWERVFPTYPLVYSFLDDAFNRSFTNMERIGNLIKSFAALAVIISCLGLFGLASFAAEERTKEIGIRKILGSSASAIILLLIKDFSRCILIATAVAWPIGYLAMNQWLYNFAYRIKIGISPLLLSAVLAFAIALITVSFQFIKAASANPVDSLRYE